MAAVAQRVRHACARAKLCPPGRRSLLLEGGRICVSWHERWAPIDARGLIARQEASVAKGPSSDPLAPQ